MAGSLAITKSTTWQLQLMQRANQLASWDDREYIRQHLNAALDADDPTMKNFHVRTALQWIELAADLERLE